MTDDEFDTALVAGAFAIAAREGWGAVSVVAAAREKDLPLDRARTRFAGRDAILLRFGRLADASAMADAPATGPTRERLFDLVMRRFDVLQTHRAGVLALLKDLPADPATGLMLAAATITSMGWMLEAAGMKATGIVGTLAKNGLLGVWLFTLRAWQRDTSLDLSTTMAALDKALSRAEQAAGWLMPRAPAAEAGPKPFPDPLAEASPAPLDAPLDTGLPPENGPAATGEA
jgi:hypothetical protein